MFHFKVSLYSRTLPLLILFFASIFLQSCGEEQSHQSQSGPFVYELDSSFTQEEQEAEQRFAKAIRENLDVFVAAYLWKWPREINTDNARELFQGYAPDGIDVKSNKNTKHRRRYTRATQRPASALAKEVYKRLLSESPSNGKLPLVIFTAGGAGSGKSTSIEKVETLSQSMGQAQIIVDTTFSSGRALNKVRMALDAGKIVKIIYIYSDPDNAFQRMLDRATDIGRPVTVSSFVATHRGAPNNIIRLAEEFEQEIFNNKIEIEVVNNSGDLDDIKIEEDGINFLLAENGNRRGEDLEKKFKKTLKTNYDNGSITKELYELIKK